MERKDTQKNNTLGLLKIFASYMVVFIHVRFYGKTGTAIVDVARFAVPFFFVTSGFYSYQISPQKIKNRIKNILSLLILATGSYTVFNILRLLSSGDLNEVFAYFNRYGDFFTLVKLFVFNVPISSYHLWYLYAILYVYIIFYFVTIFHIKDKVIFIISISLIFLQILMGEVLSIFGIVLPSAIVRNFAVMGISFFGLGLFIKKYSHKFLAINNSVILLSIIVGILESILFRYFFRKNELYLGSLFILFAFVCVFIKYSTIKYPHFFIALEGCSTYIYIFHIILSEIISEIYTAMGINMNSSVILKNLHPIIVCIISTVFAYLINKILKSLQRRKNNL